MRVPSERDREIVRLYGEGIPGTELADRYRLSRQRVDQILKAHGAVGAAEARSIRSGRRAEELRASIVEFTERYGESLRSLAAAGATRSEVERKFAYLDPDLTADVLRESINSSGVLFNVNREEYTFNQSVIEAGIWFVLARANGLEGDVPTALIEISLAELADIVESLSRLGVTPGSTHEILLAMGAARRQLSVDPTLTISKQRYEEERGSAISYLGLAGGQGSLAWPPTSQTVVKRLGKGYWTDALASLGIAASTRGRPRGLVVFEEADYRSAILDFVEHSRATGAPESYDAFEAWVSNEDRLGRQRPSAPAVRLFYQSWINAKRTVLTGSPTHTLRGPSGTAAASVARTALHDASASRRTQLEHLKELPARDRSAALVTFVKDFMGVFEARRRTWFRAVVLSDPGAVARRLAMPGLKPAQKTLLESAPPQVDAVLTDMYLDRLLSGPSGVRNTDSWLARDAQNELDSIRDLDLAAAHVMRELRNYFTHDSTESRDRLTESMGKLAQLDDRFRTDRPLTRRFVCQWLLSDGGYRLEVLSESILAAWRGMLAAEAVGAG